MIIQKHLEKWKALRHRLLRFIDLGIALSIGLIFSSSFAQATVFDAIGNYVYGGFTGPFAKGLALVVFVGSLIGLRHSDGNMSKTLMTSAGVSGAILAAPILTSQFAGAVSTGVILIRPLFGF